MPLPEGLSCSPASPAPSSAPATTARSRPTSAACRRSTRWSRRWRRSPTRRCAPRPPSSANAWPAARRSTTCCPRPSRWCARRRKRTLGLRHFDVQMIGGMVLHDGKIAEMKTGEGKTLVATLPVYLNALAGKGVHVVTVNDYLARRDAEWMGRIYGFLGLTVGVIVHGLDDGQRRAAYAARHHLRHQQRVRLRLPARQHEVPAGGHGPARLRLRDRRRGRQHPDRRGAHAADHLRPRRRLLRPVPPGQRRGARNWSRTRAPTRRTRSPVPSR